MASGNGLTSEELRVIEESPVIKEFLAYMEKPQPQVRDALCKQCGKHVFPAREGIDDAALRTWLPV